MPESSPPQSPTCADLLPLVPAFGVPATRRGPLPDAVAVCPVPIPTATPPYDDWPAQPGAVLPADWSAPTVARPDEAAALSPATSPSGAGPARSPRSGTISPSDPVAVSQPDPVAVSPPDPGAIVGSWADSPAGPARQAATAPWPSQFAQVLTETLAGSRPASQIVPWTTEQTRRRINQLGPLLATAQQPRLRRVIVTSPSTDVLEMAIVVGIGPRVRAVAVRLERAGPARAESPPTPVPPTPVPSATATANHPGPPGRWYCTAVEAA